MVRTALVLIIPLISILSLLSSGCSGSRLHALPPESYHYLNDDRVVLSTRDTITLSPAASKDSVEVRTRLSGVGVQRASVIDDSLSFQTGRLAGKAALTDIAAVYYYGVFDTSVGLLTNEEIRAYSVTKPVNTGMTIAGIGAALAFLLVEALNPFEDLDDELDKVAPTAAVVLGAGAGFLIGHRVGSAKMQQEAIEHVRSRQSQPEKQE